MVIERAIPALYEEYTEAKPKRSLSLFLAIAAFSSRDIHASNLSSSSGPEDVISNHLEDRAYV